MRILYIDIDSLRPDHLSCYGYHRHTSPHIDALAREGVRFTNYYASDTPCLPSRTALFTGQLGIRTGVVNHGGLFADVAPQGADRAFRSQLAQETLGSVLRRAGCHTASISPFPNRHSAYQVWYGFTETYDTGQGGLENADDMYPPAQRWLQANGQRDNWFLHVNFWDPHTPYDHPVAFGNPFADAPIADWITQDLIDTQNRSFGPHSCTEVPGDTDQLPARWRMGVGHIRNLADAKSHLDGYDTGIRYADHYVGKLIQDLKDLGIYEDTAIIISADHGENQGELNVWGDHQLADYITNRVPLIVKWPGVTDGQEGQACDAFFYNIDLATTLTDLLGHEASPLWQGQSMAPALRTPAAASGRPYLVLSNGAWSCQRSVRWDDWIFLRTYHTGMKDLPAYMLFNVAEDPHETHNLAASRSDLLGQGLLLLDQWMGEQMGLSQRGDPFWGVMREGGPLHANTTGMSWQAYLDRLRATGRAHHAEQLAVMGGLPLRSGLES